MKNILINEFQNAGFVVRATSDGIVVSLNREVYVPEVMAFLDSKFEEIDFIIRKVDGGVKVIV